MAEAGFTSADVASITTHHVVAKELGGPDSVYNYVIVPQAVNSHLGRLFTREGVAWVAPCRRPQN
jgi:hypothetical protein